MTLLNEKFKTVTTVILCVFAQMQECQAAFAESGVHLDSNYEITKSMRSEIRKRAGLMEPQKQSESEQEALKDLVSELEALALKDQDEFNKSPNPILRKKLDSIYCDLNTLRMRLFKMESGNAKVILTRDEVRAFYRNEKVSAFTRIGKKTKLGDCNKHNREIIRQKSGNVYVWPHVLGSEQSTL